MERYPARPLRPVRKGVDGSTPSRPESLLSPQEAAKKAFDDLLESHEEEFTNLRRDILTLEVPGEMAIFFQEGTPTPEGYKNTGDGNYWGFFDDETGSDAGWCLLTGLWKGYYALPPERLSKSKFILDNSVTTKHTTAEEARRILLEKKREELKQKIAELKETSVYETCAARVQGVSVSKAYEEAFDALEGAWERAWVEDDQDLISRRKAQWESYVKNDKETYEQIEAGEKAIRERIEDLQGFGLPATSINSPHFYGEKPSTIDEALKYARELPGVLSDLNVYIKDELVARHEIEITSQAEYDRLLAEPARPAPWCLQGMEADFFEEYKRNYGEGFGLKVAGEKTCLPGDLGVVGIVFPEPNKKCSSEIVSSGLRSFWGHPFPTGVGRWGTKLVAVIEADDWWVKYTQTDKSGLAVTMIYDAAGIHTTSRYGSDGKELFLPWSGRESMIHSSEGAPQVVHETSLTNTANQQTLVTEAASAQARLVDEENARLRQERIQRELTPEVIAEVRYGLQRIDVLLTIIERSFKEQTVLTDAERTFSTSMNGLRINWNRLDADLSAQKKGLELRDDVRKLEEKVLRGTQLKALNDVRKNFCERVREKFIEWEAVSALVKNDIDCRALIDEGLCSEETLVEVIRTKFLDDPWQQTLQRVKADTVDFFLDKVP